MKITPKYSEEFTISTFTIFTHELKMFAHVRSFTKTKNLVLTSRLNISRKIEDKSMLLAEL